MKYFWRILLLVALFFPRQPLAAAAATFSFSGPANVQESQLIQVTIRVQQAEDVDTFRLKGTFSADLLEFQNAAPAAGFTASPGNFFDQSQGVFSWGGFYLGGSIQGSGSLATFTFKAKQAGKAAISLESTSRLLSAGQDQPANVSIHQILIQSLSTVESQTSKDTPLPSPNIAIFSPTHPDEQEWYNLDTIRVRWTIEGLVPRAVFVGFDQSPTGTAKIATNANEAEFEVPQDGVWYVHLTIQDAKQKTHTETYRIQVDRHPPRIFLPIVDQTPGASQIPDLLRFGSLDDVGGIKKYEVYIDGVLGTSTEDTFFTLPPLDPGQYEVLVKAYDQAGNVTEARTWFTVEKISELLHSSEPFGQRRIFSYLYLLIPLLVLVIVFILLWRKRRGVGPVHSLSTREKQTEKTNPKRSIRRIRKK